MWSLLYAVVGRRTLGAMVRCQMPEVSQEEEAEATPPPEEEAPDEEEDTEEEDSATSRVGQAAGTRTSWPTGIIAPQVACACVRPARAVASPMS